MDRPARPPAAPSGVAAPAAAAAASAAARDQILRGVRAAAVKPEPLPDVAPDFGIHYPDLKARFAQSVQEAGGRCVFGAVEAALSAIPEYASALKVFSVVPGVSRANVGPVLDPHEYASLDFCVLQGELGVAENAAIWVRDFPNRAAAYLAQHIAIVVSGEALVHNLHEAYARLTIGPGFGQFIAGPSKTADIEQALVIGAHGARSCTVIVT